jgi:hypothetical protein
MLYALIFGAIVLFALGLMNRGDVYGGMILVIVCSASYLLPLALRQEAGRISMHEFRMGLLFVGCFLLIPMLGGFVRWLVYERTHPQSAT